MRRASDIRGKVDFGILTIRQDEYKAVLSQFQVKETFRGGLFYEVSRVTIAGGGEVTIAVARCLEQGQNAAYEVARDMIDDLDPAWILLVGIAGGLPDDDYSLGDVLLASRIYDFSVSAEILDGQSQHREWNPMGGPVHQQVQAVLAALPGWAERLKGWNTQRGIGRKKPACELPDGLENDRFLGPDDYRRKVRDSLLRHFPSVKGRVRPPLYCVASLASGNTLVKDPSLIAEWKVLARNFGFVEMEAGGVYRAARRGNREYPVLVIRGLSDIVGFKRGAEWTEYACYSAAAFTAFLIRAGVCPIERPGENAPPNVFGCNVGATAEASVTHRTAECNESSIWLGFQAASAPLLAWPKDFGKGEWIERPEYATLRERILNAPHTTTLLLGLPGSGKSALLAKLGAEFCSQQVAVLGIKADLLPETVQNLSALSAHLGLTLGVEESIRLLALNGKVIVLIDQLDALAGLIDLRTGRLNALLNLVRRLHEVPNVHVICSCREFERRRDSRLAAIEAGVVELALPAWEQVTEVLQFRGVTPNEWPSGFRELLRPPMQLKVFLQVLAETNSPRLFESYQEMLDNLWSKKITNPDGPKGRSELVMQVAAMIAKRESLWVPIASFEGREALIEELIGAMILSKASPGSAIGFAHQTLYEHALARAFARGTSSLSDHVLERQNGLFVRATLWAGLNYLRGADPEMYNQEFGRLWKHPTLRKHVKHLLIEFLGQVRSPDLNEVRWLSEAISNPPLVSRVLASVRGNPDWFTRLADSHLPRLMRETPAHGDLLSAVIASAWGTTRETCVALIKDEWAGNPSKDLFTYRTLSSLREWDKETVGLLCNIVARTEFARSGVMHMAAIVSESQPQLAAGVIASSFRSEIERLEHSIPQNLPEEPDDPDGPLLLPEEARVVDRLEYKVVRLLESSEGWYGVMELAERAPLSFLREMWPLLVRALGFITRSPTGFREEFRKEQGLGFQFPEDDDEPERHPLPAAFDRAICTLAASSLVDFTSFLNAERDRDSETVQRLLARGLAALQPAAAGLGVEFLLEDPRRFRLGHFSDEFRDTLAMIHTIVPHLPDSDIARLEAAVLAWESVPLTKSEGDDFLSVVDRYNWRARLRLLTAIPRERLSQGTQDLVDRKIIGFPDHEQYGVHVVECGFIGSPMTAQQMQDANDETVVGLFQELTDRTQWSHPRDNMLGGSIQASGEFQILAKEQPTRAILLLSQFEPGQQERPVGAALIGLAESGLPDTDLFHLINDLDARGFRSEEFRADAARAMERKLQQNVGLPDRMTELLERWLAEGWTEYEGARPKEPEKEPPTPNSVLWENFGGMGIPIGPFNALHALTWGYLLREPREADRWLAALEAHVERPGSASTWQVLSRDLKNLRLCDRDRAVRFLNRLFTRYPEVLSSQEGTCLLTSAWWFSPSEVVWAWLDQLRSSRWAKGRQAFGELLALRAYLFPEDQRAREMLGALLNPDARACDDMIEERIGLALAAANLWEDPKTRKAATDTLVRLIPEAGDRLARAILTVFRTSAGIPLDDATRHLLLAIVNNLPILSSLDEGWLLEHLEALLPNEAEEVGRIARELVRLSSESVGSLLTGWADHAARLTSIAITLQRLDSPLREMGLELFEAMLDLHLPDAQAALLEIDQRLPATPSGLLPRRHRKTRRRRGQKVE